MTTSEIRKKYLDFFKLRGHAVIPSASLVPEHDPSVLFTTAGMQPLVPYLLGTPHPLGTRVASIQKCIRTGDIDEIGDNTHLTFFEMMGNWSFGDYFKQEAIEWSYELLTSKEQGFGLDPHRLYVTCFEGDEHAPQDTESAEIWALLFKKNGITGERIYFMPAKNNWWSPGDNGPCGPDTEMFYDLTGTLTQGMTKAQYLAADEAQKVVEIWNDVFMEFRKKDGAIVGKLATKNVDTGSGLERIVAVIQNKSTIFETDIFKPILNKIDELASITITPSDDMQKARRIIADHIRAAVFIISDGVVPSTTDQGYILRRLLRRAVRYADVVAMKPTSLQKIAATVIELSESAYPHLAYQKEYIQKTIDTEEQKFRKTLEQGMKELEKEMHFTGIVHYEEANLNLNPGPRTISGYSKKVLSGESAFKIFSSYGFPIEMIIEEVENKGGIVDISIFNQELKKHQDLSRAGAEKKFKGGLADASEMSIKYHTATHLLNAALRNVLGEHIQQKGSNITTERLRFDFSHDKKMSDEEKKSTEQLVNSWIQQDLPVTYKEFPKQQAETFAIHAFNDTYGDIVKVYSIGNEHPPKYISREFCGGPHVTHTGLLGTFKIQKEEAVSAGIRRIKAILE